jgi:RNA polymerase sigma-70 factor (ECF subfamily)
MDYTNEQELIKAVRNNDVSAFTHLVNIYSQQVFTLAYRIVSSREEAEDIAQKVFLRVYKGIKNFRGDASFKSWLYTIVKNECYSHIKKKLPQMLSLNGETDYLESTPSLYTFNSMEMTEKNIDFQLLVTKCLKKLPPKYNFILQLCFQEQLKYTEISEVLQIPLSTVKTHIRRALAALKKEILIELRSINKKADIYEL